MKQARKIFDEFKRTGALPAVGLMPAVTKGAFQHVLESIASDWIQAWRIVGHDPAYRVFPNAVQAIVRIMKRIDQPGDENTVIDLYNEYTSKHDRKTFPKPGRVLDMPLFKSPDDILQQLDAPTTLTLPNVAAEVQKAVRTRIRKESRFLGDAERKEFENAMDGIAANAAAVVKSKKPVGVFSVGSIQRARKFSHVLQRRARRWIAKLIQTGNQEYSRGVKSIVAVMSGKKVKSNTKAIQQVVDNNRGAGKPKVKVAELGRFENVDSFRDIDDIKRRLADALASPPTPARTPVKPTSPWKARAQTAIEHLRQRLASEVQWLQKGSNRDDFTNAMTERIRIAQQVVDAAPANVTPDVKDLLANASRFQHVLQDVVKDWLDAWDLVGRNVSKFGDLLEAIQAVHRVMKRGHKLTAIDRKHIQNMCTEFYNITSGSAKCGRFTDDFIFESRDDIVNRLNAHVAIPGRFQRFAKQVESTARRRRDQEGRFLPDGRVRDAFEEDLDEIIKLARNVQKSSHRTSYRELGRLFEAHKFNHVLQHLARDWIQELRTTGEGKYKMAVDAVINIMKGNMAHVDKVTTFAESETKRFNAFTAENLGKVEKASTFKDLKDIEQQLAEAWRTSTNPSRPSTPVAPITGAPLPPVPHSRPPTPVVYRQKPKPDELDWQIRAYNFRFHERVFIVDTNQRNNWFLYRKLERNAMWWNAFSNEKPGMTILDAFSNIPENNFKKELGLKLAAISAESNASRKKKKKSESADFILANVVSGHLIGAAETDRRPHALDHDIEIADSVETKNPAHRATLSLFFAIADVLKNGARAGSPFLRGPPTRSKSRAPDPDLVKLVIKPWLAKHDTKTVSAITTIKALKTNDEVLQYMLQLRNAVRHLARATAGTRPRIPLPRRPFIVRPFPANLDQLLFSSKYSAETIGRMVVRRGHNIHDFTDRLDELMSTYRLGTLIHQENSIVTVLKGNA